jgi:hypothetical protein
MITVGITNADEMWKEVNENELAKKFGIQIKQPTDVEYGRELNIIDLAGVCWHFVQS